MKPVRTLTLGILFFAGCATVAEPDAADPDAEVPDPTQNGLASGGSLPTGGTGVVVTTSGGTGLGLGGASTETGGALSGGDGDGDMPDPNGMRCEDTVDCDALPGCHECLLDASSFLFTCQEASEFVECGDACVDTSDSNAHCGGCDQACSSGATCTAGECVCDGAALLCDGECVDPQTDTTNCGSCGEACDGDTPFCVNGGCAECDTPGEVQCDGACTNPQTDVDNCGTCGNQCNAGAGEECLSGTCGVGICGAEQEYSSGTHGGSCSKQRAIMNGHLWECGHWVDSAPPNSPDGSSAPCTAYEWCYVGPCQ